MKSPLIVTNDERKYTLTHIFELAYVWLMDVQPIFDAMTDATRRRLLALLVREGELCVCELTAALDGIQPKVSRHLGVLKALGLVLSRRQGTWVFYRLAGRLPRWVNELLAALADGAVTELRTDRQRLRAMDGRPKRDAA